MVVSSTTLVSCLSGIDPLPSEIKDLSMSLSIPVGQADFRIESVYFDGLPNINQQLNLPDWAKHDTIYYIDTFAVNLSKIYEYSSETPSYLNFKINVWNEFPSAGTLKIILTNASGEVIHSFWNNKPFEIKKGDILLNGVVVNPGFSYTAESFVKEDIEKLRTAENLIFHAKLGIKNTNTNSFQYFNNFKLTCHLGARVDFILNDI
ncbi:MAG: hypothetical protein AB9846_01500 [Tenuifilaceae bacterium]